MNSGQKSVGSRQRVVGSKYKAENRGMNVVKGFALFLFCLLPTVCSLLPAAQAQGGFYRGLPKETRQETGLPQAVRDVGIDQRLNEEVPLDLVFRDETGRQVQLREYMGTKPAVLALVYYDCPMLCNQVLNGLLGALKALSFDVGREFDVITVSFDPRETPQLAQSKKDSYIKRYNRASAAAGWHFLTGDEDSIKRLTEAVGFRYAWDTRTNQFAHASGIMVLTPEGRLSHYLYGIEYAPRDLRLGLIEASQNKIGSPVDKLLMFCYHYDPATGKYGAVVMNFLKLLSVIFIISLVALFWVMRQIVRRQQARMDQAGGAAA